MFMLFIRRNQSKYPQDIHDIHKYPKVTPGEQPVVAHPMNIACTTP